MLKATLKIFAKFLMAVPFLGGAVGQGFRPGIQIFRQCQCPH